MKFNLKIMALSAILITNVTSQASQMQCAMICAQADASAGTISSTDEVFDIIVEIITGKREIIVFERIIAQIDDDSLKQKIKQFAKEVKSLVGKERASKLRVIACKHLGVGATTSLTAKLLRVKSQIKEALFHMFVDQSNI